MKNPFLTSKWITTTNAVLGGEQRQVLTPYAVAPLVLNIRNARRGELSLLTLTTTDRRPTLEEGHRGRNIHGSAQVSLDRETFHAMFTKGDMSAAWSAWETGDLHAEGPREVLLYYLYHLFPNGPEGASRMAAAIELATSEA
jgi:hypothetical protein